MSVIGREPTGEPTPKPTQTPGYLQGLPLAIQTAGANVGLGTPTGQGIAGVNFINNLTKPQMKQIIPYLKVFGATKPQLAIYSEAKKFLQTNLSTLVENAGNDFNKLISLFDSEATGFGAGSDKPKSSGVTQYVTEKSPSLLKQDVDDFLLKTIGSTNVKEESRKKIMDEINKLIKQGATTTTKMNKKGDTIVTQTPGYSDEQGAAVVERVAKELEPEKYKQQKELTFFDFIQQAEQMRGGR